ncbi:MAG: hypothetical protein KIH62_001110 [Candidatus Kerfeldbacteria bacterium]|nr:hypothetical protein [Candidatus Kerfeldbacteria bacterium]
MKITIQSLNVVDECRTLALALLEGRQGVRISIEMRQEDTTLVVSLDARECREFVTYTVEMTAEANQDLRDGESPVDPPLSSEVAVRHLRSRVDAGFIAGWMFP